MDQVGGCGLSASAPVVGAMLLLSPVLLREPPAGEGSREVDVPGTVIMTASSIAGAPIAQRAITRFGPRLVGHVGLVMISLSSAGLAATAWLGGSPVAIAGCMLVFGLGMGCAFVSGTIASLKDVSERDSGIAAGIQNISFSLGTTLGLAGPGRKHGHLPQQASPGRY